MDETEKGWFVQYIDRDPETLRKMEAAKTKEKMEKDDAERMDAFFKVSSSACHMYLLYDHYNTHNLSVTTSTCQSAATSMSALSTGDIVSPEILSLYLSR